MRVPNDDATMQLSDWRPQRHFYLDPDLLTIEPREQDRRRSYIFLEGEATSCPGPLEKNATDEIQIRHYYHM
jgi:hypothetical protein